MNRKLNVVIVTLLVAILVMAAAVIAVVVTTDGGAGTKSSSARSESKADNSAESDITQRQKAFGTWTNAEKYYSYNYLTENLAGSSLVVFGSSEFNHGNNTRYFPGKLFAKTNVNPMLIGNAYNQSLSLATYLGALESKMKNRKVVLLLSPSWFYWGGVSQYHYNLRFSEIMYLKLMQAGNVPRSSKKYIAERTESLLTDAGILARVRRYNSIFIQGKSSAADKKYIARRLKALNKAADSAAAVAMTKDDITSIPKDKFTYNKSFVPDWKNLVSSAVAEDKGKRNNPYYIDDERYQKKYSAQVAYSKGSQKNMSFEYSPEYKDLRCFLDICKACKIKALLVELPMNGYWYDMTGLDAGKRRIFVKKVDKIAAAYGAATASFTKQEYSKYFMLDTVHLAGKGWTLINKKIYNFAAR